jgi:hypothetical protein
MLRGSRDFSTSADYEQFLRAILAGRNRARQGKLQEELPHMRALPPTRWKISACSGWWSIVSR